MTLVMMIPMMRRVVMMAVVVDAAVAVGALVVVSPRSSSSTLCDHPGSWLSVLFLLLWCDTSRYIIRRHPAVDPESRLPRQPQNPTLSKVKLYIQPI